LPEFVFKTTDYEGTPVALSTVTWQVKAGNGGPGAHPEIHNYQEDVRKTVEAPHLVFQSARDERSRIFYRLGVGRDKFAGKHLVVIVKYVNEAGGRRGYIGTMYLSRSVYARGDQVWPSKKTVLQ
jgi:hypothetical protein